MAQTPRKFSEKIAILERKSRAEVDEFTQVMQDVKKITTSRSPQTTPSSTPYPCSPTGGPGSSSTNQTPSATESPSGLMPDGYNLGPGGNNLYVMHPLAGMYQRSGGSLPNVHQMVQQKPGQIPQMPTNPNEQWMYWQTAQTSAGGPNPTHSQNHHPRTRSPGSAAHYHPYRSSSGNVAAQAAQSAHRNERIPPLDSHMMINNVHLQPPDPSWSNARARSDPAIHMNTMQALYYTPNGAQFPPNNQQQAQFQQQNAQFQQQQWAAQMQNGMPQNPGFYGAAINGGGPMVNGGNGQAVNQTGSQLTNGPQQGSAHQTPNHSQPGSTASSASSVPICMSSSPQQQQSQAQTPQQLSQYNGGYLKQSPCGSPDMAVGSLPNMHSPTIMQQQQYKNEQTPQQSYYDYEYDPNQQQPLQSAPATMQQYCNGGSIYAYNQSQIPQSQSQQQSMNSQYIRPQHQLSMPQGTGDSSQSAPTSPAQSFTNNPLQPQWTPTRHYSASPDNQGIPRVTLTRVEGNTECFQEEFQDLCIGIDSDIQQALLQGAEDHFDPATETQLINSTR